MGNGGGGQLIKFIQVCAGTWDKRTVLALSCELIRTFMPEMLRAAYYPASRKSESSGYFSATETYI